MIRFIPSACIALLASFHVRAEIMLLSASDCRKDPLGGSSLIDCKVGSPRTVCPLMISSTNNAVINSADVISLITYRHACESFIPLGAALRIANADFLLQSGTHTIRTKNSRSDACALFKFDVDPTNDVVPDCKIAVIDATTLPDVTFLKAYFSNLKTQLSLVRRLVSKVATIDLMDDDFSDVMGMVEFLDEKIEIAKGELDDLEDKSPFRVMKTSEIKALEARKASISKALKSFGACGSDTYRITKVGDELKIFVDTEFGDIKIELMSLRDFVAAESTRLNGIDVRLSAQLSDLLSQISASLKGNLKAESTTAS